MRGIVKKALSLLLCVVVAVNVFLPIGALVPLEAYAADSTSSTLEPVKILEIQPGNKFDISGNSQLLSELETKIGRNVVVDPMPMVEFVSKVDQVNGKYDIVYVGNNNSDGDYYCAIGEKSNKLPGTASIIGGKKDVEYYSGVDITNLSAQKIKEFIKSGQLAVFDGSIFNDELKNTKLYNNFRSDEAGSDFYGNPEYSNFVVITRELSLFAPQKGFNGECYRTKNFNNLENQVWGCKDIDFSWVEPYWPNEKLINGAHDISVRWSTSFKPNASGIYTFAASFEGEAKVKVANKKDNVETTEYNKKIIWSDNFTTIIDSERKALDEPVSGSIYLEEGEEYVLLMEYITSKKSNQNIYAHLYLHSNTIDSDKLYQSIIKYSNSSIKKRPLLELTKPGQVKPVEYNGENAIADANKIMGYKMNVHDQNGDGNLAIKLYIDINGDGIYTEDEIRESFLTKSVDGYSINHMLNDNSYTGLQPWKLEVTDENGAKNYQTGSVAFKGRELQIHVLQLLPNSNTLGLKSLGGLLQKDGEYKIYVDEMNIRDFDQSYNTSKPVQLNGKYDMVILGFADAYKNGDLTTKGAIDALDNFIKTNQSVMFTHDTIYTPTAEYSSSDSWGGKNLTKNFRDILGQNIYYNGHQTYPEPGKPSLGLTRLNLDRANDSDMPYTKVAYKLNDTLLSKYPYVLGDTIDVAVTHHQYFQLDLEDPQVIPVFTLQNEKVYDKDGKDQGQVETRFDRLDGRNDYYTYTKGNLTYSGTGHSERPPLTEKQLFINTMIKASRGANHAPSLTVTGLNNDIANTVETLDLNIEAVDDHDKYLGGCIKISADLNGDGKIDASEIKTVRTFDINSADSRLESGKVKSVTIDKSVPDTVSSFVVTVEVYDSQNALNSKYVTIFQKDEPTLTISNNIKIGYLIGDKIQGEVTVKADKSSTNYKDNYTGLTLTAGVGLTAEMAEEGWNSVSESSSTVTAKLQDIEFKPDPTVTEQNKIIDFTCSGTDGQSKSIPLKLQYENKAGIVKSVESAITYGVKAGGFSVEVKDAKQRSIPNVTVNVVKKNATSSFETLHGESDISGLARFNNLNSGEYEVSINLPDGYVLASDNTPTRTVSLSYDHPSEMVTYNLTGSPVSSLSFTNGSGSFNDKIYVRNGSTVNGDRSAKVNITLNRDITSAELKFESNVASLSITGGIIKNSDGVIAQCEYKDGRLYIPDSFSLSKGDYVIDLNYSVGDSISDGQYFGLSQTDAIYVRETNADPADPEDYYAPSSRPSSTIFSVSTSAISGIRLTDMESNTNIPIQVVENGGVQVKVAFTVNEPVTIASLDMLFKSLKIQTVPVDFERVGVGSVDISNGLNNIELTRGEYVLTLYIDGTDIFTSGTSNEILQLTNIACQENIDGQAEPVLSNASVRAEDGSIAISVGSLYDLE